MVRRCATRTTARAVAILAALAPSLAVQGLAEAACLPNAVPPESRALLGGLDGNSSVPFGLFALDWDSAQLASHVVKLLAEEVLGYSSKITGVGVASLSGLYATAGCRAPNEYSVDPRCGSRPAFTHHASLEIWGPGDVTIMREALARWPEVIPEDVGDMGYEGIAGMHVLSQQRQEAFLAEGLHLEYYGSYNAAWHRPSAYFVNYTAFDTRQLKPCQETSLMHTPEARDYLRVTGDHDGVVQASDGSLSARCSHGSWWFAPACRSTPELCVPFLTAGDGWSTWETMQKAAAHNMPLAVTVARTLPLWRSLGGKGRVLPLWWQPDSTFIESTPTLVVFPPHNPLEHEENKFTSAMSGLRLSKWVHKGLGLRASRLRELVKRTVIPMSAINEMLLEHKSSGSTYEDVACGWLRKHEDIWGRWIPRSTDCVPGQGLVSSDGSFSRSRASSSACGWCPPGRRSVELTDNLGKIYFCSECEPGRSQPRPRQQKCDACLEGSFADGHGSHECRACSLGEYADALGRSACDACPLGFATNLRGATSLAACICPEGSYRDEDRRGTCLPCKEGMTCPEGSDVLGYSPQHAVQHPIVPLLKVGFWSSGEEPLSVFRCKDGLRCPGGAVPGRACAEKFASQGCADCQAGLVLSRDGCVPCATGFLRILVFPLAPLAATTVVILILYHRSSGQPYAQWDSWKNGAGTTVFVVLSHYHVVNIIGALAALSDASSDSTFEAVSVLSDLVSLFKPECGGLRTFMSRLVLESHGPGALLLIFSVVWLASRALGRWRPTLRMETDRLVDCYVYLILAFFARVVDMAFTVFKCADNPNGLYTLVYDRSVVCYQGRWNGMVVVGASAMLLWCVGFCAVVLHAIRMAPRQFHVAAWRTRWTSLFVSFRPDVHWWFLPIVLKGVLLNSGSLFIHSGVGQIYWIQSVLLVYMYLLVAFRPWRHLLNNPADDVAHLSLCLICSTCFWLARDAVGSNPAQTGLMVGLLQANVSVAAVPLIPIVALMWWRDCSRIARDRKDTEAKLIVRQLKLMAACDYQQQLQFLKSLTEHDFELISQTMEVLLMEQGHKMVRSGYSASQLSKLSRHSVARTTSEDSMRRLFTKTGSGLLGAVRLSITGPREGAHGGLGQHAGSLFPFLISKSGFFRTAPLADGGAVDLAGAGVVPAPSNSDEPEQDNSASSPDEPGQDNSDDESCFSL